MPDICCSQSLFKEANLLQDRIEFSSVRILHDDVNFALVEEEPIHIQNIFMFDMAMNFKFPSDLIEHIAVNNLLL